MAENVTPTRGKPVEDKANCSPFDLGVLFEELRQFSDQRKFELINNVWRPGSTFLFPKTKESGRNRRFNSSWLQDFPWLVYSRYSGTPLIRTPTGPAQVSVLTGCPY